jgi:hypothetical protein
MTATVRWEELPDETRKLVEQRIGPVVKAEPAGAGFNHHVAAILHTHSGAVFIKGVGVGDRRAIRQAIEAAIATTAVTISPDLLWHLPDANGWNLLAFEAVIGARHASLAPGTEDLEPVTRALRALGSLESRLGGVTDRIERRWAEYAAPGEVDLLQGEQLLHTDLRPDNMLIRSDQAWVVDWSWPTFGAAWIDPASVALWLIAEGHHPRDAQAWLQTVPTAKNVSTAAMDAFTAINARLWFRIATDDPQPWKNRLAKAANDWASYRGSSPQRRQPARTCRT